MVARRNTTEPRQRGKTKKAACCSSTRGASVQKRYGTKEAETKHEYRGLQAPARPCDFSVFFPPAPSSRMPLNSITQRHSSATYFVLYGISSVLGILPLCRLDADGNNNTVVYHTWLHDGPSQIGVPNITPFDIGCLLQPPFKTRRLQPTAAAFTEPRRYSVTSNRTCNTCGKLGR